MLCLLPMTLKPAHRCKPVVSSFACRLHDLRPLGAGGHDRAGAEGALCDGDELPRVCSPSGLQQRRDGAELHQARYARQGRTIFRLSSFPGVRMLLTS